MNNNEIGAAFVAMCNGTQEKKNVNGRNNLSITTDGKNVTLWSYNTAIAYYCDAKELAIISTYFYSPSTAKHQATVKGRFFDCKARFVNFTEWNASGADLLKYDVSTRYRLGDTYTVTTANGRHVTRQNVIDSVETWDYYHNSKTAKPIFIGITPARAARLVDQLNEAERVKY